LIAEIGQADFGWHHGRILRGPLCGRLRMTVIIWEITMALPDSITERARQGAKVRREVLGAAYVDAGKQQANPFTQHFIEFTQSQCWGNVWLREGLSHKTRSQLNVCMLAALARWHEFEVHVRGALNNGVTPEEIAEILLHSAVYAGIPIASEGFRRADAVIKAVAAEKG
jgi:4-carboxymuconolactone decarboxylase